MFYLKKRNINKYLQTKIRRFVDHLDDAEKKNAEIVDLYFNKLPSTLRE
jgi:hypothetical protein